MIDSRFSVIIPVYNGAPFIGRAINSVLSQTYPAEEIIVVDDGSADATPDVVARYGAKVRYLRQSNQGVSMARNAGARAARGDWLAFLDADDWYYPDRLRMHAELIRGHGAFDFLTGDYEYRDESGVLLGRSLERHPAGRHVLDKAAGAAMAAMEEDQFEEFIADHFGDMHTLSVPKSTFLEVGGYPQGFKVCEDVHFLVRLVSRSRRAGVVCQPLGVYLIHDSSATRRDRVVAQRENVRTLLDLKRFENQFSDPVRRGFRRLLSRSRADLAYALVRTGQRAAALGAVVPSVWEYPGARTARVLASVLRG